jgi:hypothetical protein
MRTTLSLGGVVRGNVIHGGSGIEMEIAKQTTAIVHPPARFEEYADVTR